MKDNLSALRLGIDIEEILFYKDFIMTPLCNEIISSEVLVLL